VEVAAAIPPSLAQVFTDVPEDVSYVRLLSKRGGGGVRVQWRPASVVVWLVLLGASLIRVQLPHCRLKHHMRTLLRSAHERDPFVDVIVVSVGLWEPRQ
jgi:hypothetical protein